MKTSLSGLKQLSRIWRNNKNTSDKSAKNLRARSVKANRADNRGTGGRKKKGK